jgi:large repetitive protein
MAAGTRSPNGVVRYAFVAITLAIPLSLASQAIDTTPPTVSITAPADGATVSGATTVTANAADNVGVAGVQLAVDGVPLGAEFTAAPYSTTWMTQGSTDLIFGVVKHKVGAMTISAGSGFTKRLGVSCPNCTGDDMASVDKIQSTAGAAAATFTFSAPAHYLAHVAAFKAATTPAYLQGAAATTNAAGATLAKAFTAPTTAASLLVVAVAWQGTAPLTVTDTRGNSYAVAITAYDTVMGQSLAILYAANVSAGATTVTAGFGSAASAKRLEIHEYAGMVTTTPLDGAATNIGEGTTTPSSVTSGAASTTATAAVPDGNHTLTAVARDAAGNQTTSVPVTVTVGLDTTPPVISNVTVSSVTASGATITWTTNESSTSQVSYGPTTAYGSTSALDATPVTAHTVTLSGLSGSSLYHARVQSRDGAGNLVVSGDITFSTLDGAAPSVSITTPAGGAIVSASIPVTAGASDNVGVVGVQMRLDGALLGAEVMTSPYTMSWNTTTSASGSHTLTAIARDTAGNQTTSAAVIVTVSNDSTPPVISAVTVSSITATAATIGWTTDEASDSQVDFGLTTAYGSTSALNATPVTAHTVSLSGLNGGTLYHARVRSRDAAGNLAVSGDVTFTTLDASPPTVSITAPAAGATISGTTTVSANAADNVGVAGVQFAVDGVPLGAEITAAPYSTPWMTQGSTDLIFGVVKVAVGPMTITAGSGLTKRLGVSCPSCTGDDTVSVDRIQSTAGTADATFTFSAPAHYVAHVAAFKAATTPVYLQAAAATTNVAGASLAQAFTAPLTAGSLIVAAVAWQGSAPLTVTDTQGNSYAVAATAYDPVMGQSLAILYAANVTAGATTVTAGFGSQSPTAKRLELHEYAGMATTNPFDGTAMTIGEGPTTPNAVTSGAAPTTVTASVPDGTHTLTAVARDAAGNAATSAAVPVTVLNDVTPPTVSITAPVGGAMVTGMAMVTANASDNTGVAGVQFRLDGVSLGTEDTTAPYSVSWNTATATNGSHALTATARDAAGRQTTSAGVTVTVSNDTTPPAVSITAPAGGAIVTGTVTLTANASDNIGVGGVQFKLDGASLGAEDTTAAYSVSWNTTTATNGSHALTATARDAAGNVMTSAAITVTASNDTTPPVISAVTVSSLQSSGATIGWATNEVSNSEVEYGLTTAYGGFSSLDVNLVTAHTMTLVGLAPSTLYHVRARSRDVAGNLGLSADFTLTTLEGTPPSVSITAPANGSTVSGTVTVTASASDNVGVVGVEFRLDGVPGVEDTAAPYSVLWDTTAQSPGSHTLTAVARDAAGNRTTSAVVTVTVAGPTGQLTLGWDASTDASVVGVKVYVGTTSGVYTVSVVDVGNVTGYTVTGLQSGTVYYFAVTGYDQGGMESGFSNQVSTTIP